MHVMKLVLNITEPLQRAAQRYFEAAKRARKKAKGARAAIERARKEAKEAQHAAPRIEKPSLKQKRKKEWYERFRWCLTSDGFLLVGGRDATTNEILIKKHTEKNDIVFHTDMAASPFVILKTKGKTPPDTSLEEAAGFVAIHSRAWKLGLSTTEVFHVRPDQVSKEAKAGEVLPKGSFMIYGKTTYHHPRVEAAVGLLNGSVLAGPISAVTHHCKQAIQIKPGRMKKSEAAKQLRNELGGGELDDYLSALPSGGISIVKEKQTKKRTATAKATRR
ncbi:DUF814 domain-containing protein [Candidatus Woesearchaeota archaeon]|nr:MAG: DUF814 domain-containing protein [Candidatus Woesearchaeota archaeon]